MFIGLCIIDYVLLDNGAVRPRGLLFVICFPDWLFYILQYFIGVTLLALVPDIPEIVIGIQFALQNNISLR